MYDPPRVALACDVGGGTWDDVGDFLEVGVLNKIICGDVLSVLKTLEPESVQCCVTSPPYWGLRDYQVDGQIGLEKTPEEYVSKMGEVFREVRRVLRGDGTCWVNLGDSYWGGKGQSGHADSEYQDKRFACGESFNPSAAHVGGRGKTRPSDGKHDFIKPKDLCGIPWRVAFALQADGWWLRSDIIWAKPNPMPESVTDRPTKSHEYIFLLTKSATYYYDAEAISEPLMESSIIRNQSGWNGNEDRDYINGKQNNMSKYLGTEKAKNETHRNKRSVWTIATNPYPDAHFATFPQEIPLICIKAGTSEKGCCSECGSPLNRITEYIDGQPNPNHSKTKSCVTQTGGISSSNLGGTPGTNKTVGWKPSCNCRDGETVPCVVLDPFSGAGTTCMVAKKLERRYVGVELNPKYVEMSERRIETEVGTLL